MLSNVLHQITNKTDDMNKRTIELADALPSYDIKDLVIFHPEGADREMVCRVAGHDRTGPELIYQLVDPLYDEKHLALFSDLKPHVDPVWDDTGFEANFDAGILDELDEYASSSYCE